MPGRSYSNGSDYRYGFNGKEKDAETAVDDYDFGARIYDARIGRWFSMDDKFKDLPFFSPYVFVNNNPMQYLDPDGRFLLDVHQRIVKTALKKLTSFHLNFWKHWNEPEIKKQLLYIDFLDGLIGDGTILSGGIVYPDIHQSSTKSAHFDEMNYGAIVKNFDEINKQISSETSDYKSNTINAKTLGAKVGHHLHAIQDFYSHSNYVELYIQTYGKNNLADIPTFEDALSDSKFEKFAAVLKDNLKTGNYPGTGAGSHKEMNHDVGAGSNYTAVVPETRGKKVTAETKAAEAVATKATTQYLQKVGEQISSHDDRKN